MADWGDQLFSSIRINTYLEQKKNELEQEILNIVNLKTLEEKSDLIQEFYDKYHVEKIVLIEDKIKTFYGEKDIDISQIPNRSIIDRSKPIYEKGTFVNYYIPFKGDETLFACIPPYSNSHGVKGIIQNNELIFYYKGLNLTEEDLKKQLNTDLSNTKEYLRFINDEIERYNINLNSSIENIINQRKNKLLNDKKLVKSLGFPLKERKNSSDAYKAPMKEKKVIMKEILQAAKDKNGITFIEASGQIVSLNNLFGEVLFEDKIYFEVFPYLIDEGFLVHERGQRYRITSEGDKFLQDSIKPDRETHDEEFDLQQIILNGESDGVEFKSTLRTNMHTGEKDQKMEYECLKTMAAFLNTNGGVLIVGIADDRTPIGIKVDDFKSEDKMKLHLVNIVKSRMGVLTMTLIHEHFDDYEDCRILVVRCSKSTDPIFLKDGKLEKFYIRTGPSTTELTGSEIYKYTKNRFKD